MRRGLALGIVLLLLTGCAAILPSHPHGAYYPPPGEADTVALSTTLYRAAQAAGDDPARYSFALVKTSQVAAYAADEAVFYFSEPLAKLPQRHVDALVAQKVAHEVLGHAGQRRTLSISISAGFAVLGFVVPGLGLVDLVANPLIVRAFTRDQETAADLKAVEILRAMGHEAPKRTLARALLAVAAANRPPKHEGLLATEPELADRLAALEPLEPLTKLTLRAPTPDSR
jgi:Zn-dependent protease with chaperone function